MIGQFKLNVLAAAIKRNLGGGGLVNPQVVDFSYKAHQPVGAEAAYPTAIHIKPDGLKMYVLDDTTNYIFQYSLSTAWDVSTATYDSVFFDFAWDFSTHGLDFSPDGLNMVVTQHGSSEAAMHLNLSVAWDLSTATIGTQYGLNEIDPNGITYSADGTQAFVTHLTQVREYILATPYAFSSVTVGDSFDLSAQSANMQECVFSQDGLSMYALADETSSTGNPVFQYTLGTAWDITTAVADGVSYDFSNLASRPLGLHLPTGMDYIYVVDTNTDNVYQYYARQPVTATYATWNTIDTAANITISDGALRVAEVTGTRGTARATQSLISGKHYFEHILELVGGTAQKSIGFLDTGGSLTDLLGTMTQSHSYEHSGNYRSNGSFSADPPTQVVSDVIMVAIDMDAGHIWYGINGTWNEGDPAAGTGVNALFDSAATGRLYPAVTMDDGQAITNFGASAFAYAVPTGFREGVYTGTP